MAADALKTLHTTLLDTLEGYEAAEREAEDPALKLLFREMIDLRSKDHTEIHEALAAAGEHLADEQSFMATVHKAAVDLRSAVIGIDRKTLEPFIKGEEIILEQYDAAISEADGPVVVMLRQQKIELDGKVFAMRSMV